jgi:predicted MPP superfamily phosphohydrolase
MDAKRALVFVAMILVWGLAHFWVAHRLRLLFHLGRWPFWLTLAGMLLLGFSYIPSRFLGRTSFQELALVLEALASVWMALFIALMLVFGAVELLNLGLTAARPWTGLAPLWARLDPARGFPPGGVALLLLGLIGLAAGHLAAQSPRLIRLQIDQELAAQAPPSPSPQDPQYTRLLFLSDLHLGSVGSSLFLARALELGLPTRPQVVLLGGDIIEHAREDSYALLDQLLAAFPGVPFYMVPGNHEQYARILRIAKHLATRPQVRLLRNESLELAPGLRLAGADDPHLTPTSEALQGALSKVLPEDLLLLLWHRPGEAALLAQRPRTVILSGHTHGGQIFPMTLLAPLANGGFRSGLHQLGPKSVLFVSNGAGLWGPPIRLGATPDLVLLELALPPGGLTP